MLNSKIEQRTQDIRCLACDAVGDFKLDINSSQLKCGACHQEYRIEQQRPVLLSGDSKLAFESELETEHGKAMVAEYSAVGAKAKPSLLGRIYNIVRPPEIMLHYNQSLTNHPLTEDLFSEAGAQNNILNVGGGPTRYSDHEVTLNIRPFHNVDCVADAHNIPFGDNSFDVIICNAVLEHVYDPETVVSEMIRVLKPGGKLYAEVPFIFFFHGYPNDFKRYTQEGMKRLFSGLDTAEFGMTHGPASSILQSINVLIDIVVPDHLRIIKKVLNGVYRWLFFPFKYLDLLLVKNEKAHILAGGFYVIGRKATGKTKVEAN